MKKQATIYTFFILCAGLLVLPTGLCSDELGDAEKKRIVYEMFTEYSKEFPSVKIISPGQAMTLSDAEAAVFVDIRQGSEMSVSVIPGAITQKEFLDHIHEYKNKKIVAYCTIGYRSGRFAEKMTSMNIDVYNLQGGILAWALEGGNVHDLNGITRRIHVYGKKWDYVPDGYESIRFGFFEKLFK